MDLLTQFAFSSDAAVLAMVGTGFMLFAAFCAMMERRRNRLRSLERLEKVGWVPWTNLFVGCLIIGGGCLAMSLPALIASL